LGYFGLVIFKRSKFGHGTYDDDDDDRSTSQSWYAVFCDTLDAMDIEMVPQVFPAAMDSRFMGALGIRALGFSPMRNTGILLRKCDERILEHNYLEGIGINVELIQALGSRGRNGQISIE
jgi:hypothetical protein